MKFKKLPVVLLIIVSGLSMFNTNYVFSQSGMPEILENGELNEQLEYIQERTNIYNNYRAIREDMFLKLKTNVIDSLNSAKNKINDLKGEIEANEERIAELNSSLLTVQEERDEAVKNRDSLSFLGIPLNKVLYNSIMWGLVLILAGAVVMIFLLFKRNRVITRSTRKELKELEDEFETHKKKARERHEKLVVSHFNEMKKLKDDHGIK